MISSSGNMTKQSSRKIHSCEDNDALADDHSTPEERPPDGDDKSVSADGDTLMLHRISMVMQYR